MRTKSNRVQTETITQPQVQQTESPIEELAICRETRDAFIELDNAASAAVALAVLNASHIAQSMHDNAGWEEFKSSVFGAGQSHLPWVFNDAFRSSFSSWDHKMNAVIEMLKSEKPDGNNLPMLKGEMEHFMGGINHLLSMQGAEIDKREAGFCYGCDRIVRDNLSSAFSRAWKAYHQLVAFVHARTGAEVAA